MNRRKNRFAIAVASALATAAALASIVTVKDENRETLYYANNFDGGGFEIRLPGRTAPVVVSQSGSYDPSEDSPLKALVEAAAGGKGVECAAPPAAGRLKAATGDATGSFDVSSFDLRVEPMVKAKWTQDTKYAGQEPAFNYYTPNNYPCGCVAAAFIQIMRYWEWPAASAAGKSFTCWIDGKKTVLKTIGGAYRWNLMPFEIEEDEPEETRSALGHLAYDFAVSINTDFTPYASSAWGDIVPGVLATNFGYAYARAFDSIPEKYDATGENLSVLPEYANAILASLDGGMPVCVGIISTSTKYGHQMVVDGYAADRSGRIYCHVNFGWSGMDNAWYALMDGTVADERFDTFCDVTYNIHPTVPGDVISGRVLDSAGKPVAGAKVELLKSGSSSPIDSTTSKSNGIYALRFTGKGNFTVRASLGSRMSATSVSIAKASENVDGRIEGDMEPMIYNYNNKTGVAGTVANKWGVDVSLPDSDGGGGSEGGESGGESEGGESGGAGGTENGGEGSGSGEDGEDSGGRGSEGESQESKEAPYDATSAAAVFDGVLKLPSGDINGTILAKVGKAKKSTRYAKVSATVVRVSEAKKLTYKGEMAPDGTATLACAGKPSMTLYFGEYGLYGDLAQEGTTVAGTRNLFSSKDKAEAAGAKATLETLPGTICATWTTAAGRMILSIVKGSKGKIKITGSAPGAVKVSASAQLLMKDRDNWSIPVVNTKKYAFSFTLVPDGNGVSISGVLGAKAGKPGTLAVNAAFSIDADEAAAMLDGDTTFAEYLPDETVRQEGKKWIVAGGVKAGKITFVKNTRIVDETKAGANPSALKLSYNAKNGQFKGSFKAYKLVNDKPKSVSVSIAGALIEGIGYGTASVKKAPPAAITIAPLN